MLLMLQNLIVCLWIRPIFSLIICLFLALPPCSPSVHEQNATGIIRGGTVLLGLFLCTHFKSEVMGHFRRLLLHTHNCQYTVITKGPFSSEISIAYVHCTQKAALGDFIDDNLVNKTLWFNVFWHQCLSYRQAAGWGEISPHFTCRALSHIHVSQQIFIMSSMRKGSKEIERLILFQSGAYPLISPAGYKWRQEDRASQARLFILPITL